jgi:hypothetical protein
VAVCGRCGSGSARQVWRGPRYAIPSASGHAVQAPAAGASCCLHRCAKSIGQPCRPLSWSNAGLSPRRVSAAVDSLVQVQCRTRRACSLACPQVASVPSIPSPSEFRTAHSRACNITVRFRLVSHMGLGPAGTCGATEGAPHTAKVTAKFGTLTAVHTMLLVWHQLTAGPALVSVAMWCPSITIDGVGTNAVRPQSVILQARAQAFLLGRLLTVVLCKFTAHISQTLGARPCC